MYIERKVPADTFVSMYVCLMHSIVGIMAVAHAQVIACATSEPLLDSEMQPLVPLECTSPRQGQPLFRREVSKSFRSGQTQSEHEKDQRRRHRAVSVRPYSPCQSPVLLVQGQILLSSNQNEIFSALPQGFPQSTCVCAQPNEACILMLDDCVSVHTEFRFKGLLSP